MDKYEHNRRNRMRLAAPKHALTYKQSSPPAPIHTTSNAKRLAYRLPIIDNFPEEARRRRLDGTLQLLQIQYEIIANTSFAYNKCQH
ncbi:hypothetical protein EWB00_004339 [Schistosoma japonicum]|uniref:Uncharacterized protein n=1 Tax=Schistosoma japonicum TaxID=6182 RepID=A0A4Z2D5W4_SCHJA|nr:hypothetical protein EWB00_004339 [Schistosoma japonicum]